MVQPPWASSAARGGKREKRRPETTQAQAALNARPRLDSTRPGPVSRHVAVSSLIRGSSTAALLGLGLVGLGVARRSRR